MVLSHTMKIIEVKSETDQKEFLELPLRIYANDPEWIRPMNHDVEMVFDPKKNKFFRHGRLMRWLLKDSNDLVIGRVAAFVNDKTANKNDQPTGGMGFFECINDQQAANLLFDKCVEWLKLVGMEAMDGPINFGERDRWWGLLVDGFYEPVYAMNYNPPYYKQLFENFGFKEHFQQYCFALKVHQDIDPKFEKAYHLLSKNPDYRAEHIKKNNLEKYAADFTEIYNKAWAKHAGGKNITLEQTVSLFKKMKPVMEEDIIFFVYHKNQPVGAWLNLPELNQYFKHLDGKFGLFQKLRFLWLKHFGKNEKLYGIVFGVIPEQQGKGVDGFMIWSGAQWIRKRNKYKDMEIQWIGDFNPKMISIVRALGTQICRTLITYRYLFDRTKPFQRLKIIDSDNLKN
jgi:hypothetical protein